MRPTNALVWHIYQLFFKINLFQLISRHATTTKNNNEKQTVRLLCAATADLWIATAAATVQTASLASAARRSFTKSPVSYALQFLDIWHSIFNNEFGYCMAMLWKDKGEEVSIFQLYSLDCILQNDDTCLWSNDDTRSSVEWTFNKPSLNGLTETQQYFASKEPRFKTGPQNGDHTSNRCKCSRRL